MNRKLFAIAILMLVSVPLGAVRAGATPSSINQLFAIQQASGSSTPPMTPVGSGFTYQGGLLDGGSPANGQYDIRFTLFDAAAGGNQVGSIVTLTNQTVTNGLFTVVLDFGAIAFRGDTRFLLIEIQHNGGGYVPLSPRQPLAPAPYAMSLMPGAVISGTTSVAMVQATNNGGGGGSALSGIDPLGTGVSGSSVSGNGVKGSNNSNTLAAVGGLNLGNGPAITGLSVGGDGVQGTSSGVGAGVKARSTGGTGVDAQGKAAGVYGVGTDVNAAGVWGVANSGTDAAGVYGTSSSGYGAEGISTANNGAGVYGVDNGGIDAVGVYGESSTGVGVKAKTTATSGAAMVADAPNGYTDAIYAYGSSAGIVATGENGAGVSGQCINNCPGVQGYTNDNVGVLGSTANGTGVEARGNGSGTTALKISNGAIKVTGAGDRTQTAAFVQTVHTGAGGNTCASGTFVIIDNVYANNDPTAIILVTPFIIAPTSISSVGLRYQASPVQDCPGNRWLVQHTGNGAPFAEVEEFNVLVIKP